jgi:hypothetical protein
MAESAAFPYEPRLKISRQPLEIIDDKTLARQVTGSVVCLDIVHRTRAFSRTGLLTVENAGLVPTGN